MSSKEVLGRIEQWYAAKLLRVYTPVIEKNLVRSALVNIAEHIDDFQTFSAAYKFHFGLDELTDLYKPNNSLPVLRSDFFSRAYDSIDSKLDLFVGRVSFQDVDCAFVQTYHSVQEFADWVVSTTDKARFFNDVSLTDKFSDEELQKSKNVVLRVLIKEPVYDFARLLFDDIEGKSARKVY
ncbi:hypothetical protein HY484_02190 [Candidatus Woesearchaeota archaeon]|nr:hypothetical protein [Candidatus Woesearchaeota archaeon]